MAMQEGARAELEGVTFIGYTELGATESAPAISRITSYQALMATSKSRVRMKGDTRTAGIILLLIHTRLALITSQEA
jgi:hypothetical protein